MTQAQQKQYDREYRASVQERLSITKKEYKRLLIWVNRIHRYDEQYCNGCIGYGPVYRRNKIINEYTEDMYTADKDHAFDAITRILEGKKIWVFHQSDPRGISVYLSKNEIDASNYPQKGYAIY